MPSLRTTFTLDEELADRARQLGVNISAAARQGVADAVRAALARADREAYLRYPEHVDVAWADVEAWSRREHALKGPRGCGKQPSRMLRTR